MSIRYRSSLNRFALGGLLLAIAVLGCNRGAAPPPPAKPEPSTNKDDAAARRMKQTFEEAKRKDAPAGAPQPPDVTITGKSVGKIYTDVVRLWKEVPFETAEGKRIEYSATLETDLGTMEMALLPELAPNHVRNFVALARAGYYDGLVFDYIGHEGFEAPDSKGQVIDSIEAGGPLGASDPKNHDSVGYWLKPEIDPKSVDDEGSVGAVRGEEIDSAGCKFYIMLTKAPPIPNELRCTIFGKITQGLDIAHKIREQPVVELEEEVGFSRPLKPVVIRKVTIHTTETDTPPSGDSKTP